MADRIRIPMFPLTIFPLPGELVPLHIFEPRYRQLLKDAEDRDFSFGIYFNHTVNTEKLGSLVKLESVLKRYPGGETDVIVKSQDIFSMETLYRTFKEKPYPGGEVEFWQVDLRDHASIKLQKEFEEFMRLMQINKQSGPWSVFQIAIELGLDLEDRLKFVLFEGDKREAFLSSRLKFQTHLLTQAEKAKDVFHLN